MKPGFFCQPSAALVINSAVDQWNSIARQCIEERGRFIVALSGGKTPVEFYRRLAKSIDPGLWSKTHIFAVDERCVPANHRDSNFLLVRQALLDPISLASNVHWPFIQGTDPQEAANQYEHVLKDFFEDQIQGYPQLDLVCLGIGEDGHTASLFPGDITLEEKNRCIAPVYRSDGGPHRITLTLPVLNQARHVFFLVLGASKARIMAKICQKGCDLPASRVFFKQGKVYVFLDQAADSMRGIPS